MSPETKTLRDALFDEITRLRGDIRLAPDTRQRQALQDELRLTEQLLVELLSPRSGSRLAA